MVIHQFDRFMLDPQNRMRCADGIPVDLNARYPAALFLLVEQARRLVTKDRFIAAAKAALFAACIVTAVRFAERWWQGQDGVV